MFEAVALIGTLNRAGDVWHNSVTFDARGVIRYHGFRVLGETATG